METRLLPRFEWVTPTICVGVVPDPATGTAIEVEVIRCSVDEFKSLLRNRRCVGGRNPDPIEG
jgi:hypothetical protein